MALEFIKLVKGSSAISQVGNFGFFKLSADNGGGGGGDFDRVFGNNTLEQIATVSAEISANNMTSAQVAETYGWNSGDTIDIILTTGEVTNWRIIGFNHDDKSDGSGKAGITLQMTHALKTAYPLILTSVSGRQGYRLNETNVLNTFPIELKNILKKIKKTTGSTSRSGSALTIDCNIALISSKELNGPSQINVGAKYVSIKNYEDEGVCYEYWSTHSSKIMQRDTNDDGVLDTNTIWVTRSFLYNSTASQGNVYVTASGGLNFNDYSRSDVPIVPIICV